MSAHYRAEQHRSVKATPPVAERRAIRFDDWPSDRVIVTEGLYPGDVVILDPAAVKPR